MMQLAMMMLLDGMMVGANNGKGEREEEMERIVYWVGLFSFPEALGGSFRSTSFSRIRCRCDGHLYNVVPTVAFDASSNGGVGIS